MSVEDVENAIVQVLLAGESLPAQFGDSEMALRYAVIDPVLAALGWCVRLPWECQPGFDLGQRRPVDYALFDRDGYVAILIEVETVAARRRDHRERLRRRVRGRSHGIAVLTYGWTWEIYDLSVRARAFDGKRVERLYLDTEQDGGRHQVADRLYRWLGKAHWW